MNRPTPPAGTVGPVIRALLVRHGQSEWNAAGRWQGQADPPLSPLGRQQAADAADTLAATTGPDRIGAVVASDLARARETAEIVAARLSVGPVALDPGLRERDVGEWSGLTRAEIHEQWPGYLADDAGRSARALERRPPSWEPDESLLARTLEALRRLVLAHLTPETAVLCVGHGGMVMNLERHLGADEGRLPNLAGRWVDLDGDGKPSLGERKLLVPAAELTVGRRGEL